MRRWYSKRGARRGLLLAAFSAAIWAGWAVGYVHGSRSSAQSSPNVTAPSRPDVARARRAEL